MQAAHSSLEQSPTALKNASEEASSTVTKPSDSIQTPPTQTKFQSHWQNWNRISLDTRLWEVASISVCIACLFRIVGILLAYDQKPQPQMDGGISGRWIQLSHFRRLRTGIT